MRPTMILKLVQLAIVGALLTSCVSPPPDYQDTDQFVTSVTVIDVKNGRALPDHTVVIRDDRILDVQPSAKVKVPDGASVLASEGYVTPGLWDMHVHTMTAPDTAIDYFFPLFIANGVTGVRDMGSVVEGIVETRQRLADDPSIVAPHLYVAGPLLDGQALPWYGDLPLVLKTAEDVNRELPKLQAAGMDFFKVYDALPREAYEAVIAYGETHDMPVAGHAPHDIALTGAGLAGQRTVEHLSPFGFRDCVDDPDRWFQRAINAKFGQGYQVYYTVTQELFDVLDRESCGRAFQAMAAGNVRFTPTLVMELNDRSRVPAEDLAYIQPGNAEWCEVGLSGIDQADPELRETVYAGYGDLLMQMRASGITILAGSDVPNNCLVPGFSLHWELARQVEVGYSPLEALQNATLHAADAMDRGDTFGQVAPGFTADLVLLAQNPLDDIDHLRSIEGVMTRGEWIGKTKREALMQDVLEKFPEPTEPATEAN